MQSFIIFAMFVAGARSLQVDFADSSWKERPVTKVINLLKDMQAQLEKEAAQDEEMYEGLACWCESNDKEKTKAIADEKQRITDLTAAIEGFTAKSSQLTTEIEKLNKDIAKDQSMLAQATEVRSKENAEFAAEQKDMAASAASLKGAVEALGKAHPSAASLMQVKDLLRHHMQKHRSVVRHNLSGKQHKVVLALLQENAGSTYTPASGAIFGILKQMKEGFETNMATADKEEKQAASEFAELKSAKDAQIKASEDLVDSKSVELAAAQDKKAQSQQDLEDTEAALKADTTFLANLKDKCESADKDYEERQKTRAEEIGAVSEALGVLTSDESQQAFSRSQSFVQESPKSFIQLSLHTRRMSAKELAQEKAAKMLKAVAMKSGNRQLMQLSIRMQKDFFGPIKAKIGEMIAELKKIQAEEAEKHEYCEDELKANGKQTKAKKGLKADLEQTIADLTATAEKLSEEIAALAASIASANLEMKKAGENREKENADFQVTVADQKATQAILKKALDKLKGFYEKKGFIQTGFKLDQTPPKQMEYKKSGGATAVMFMMEGIIKESESVEKMALKGENDAQAAYEEFIADSNGSITAMQNDITSKTVEKAKTDKGKVEAEKDLAATIDDLIKLGDYNVALHQDCDFLLKNFEIRQSSRAEEIEALNNAIAIFSGANYGF